MKSYNELLKNFKLPKTELKLLKIAILGDTSTQMYSNAMHGYGFEVGYNFEIYEGSYEQIDLEISNTESELYAFNPEIIILFYSTVKLLKKFLKTSDDERIYFADSHIEKLKMQCSQLAQRISCKIICFNYNELNDAVFGNYSNKTSSSFIYQLRKINFNLMNLSSEFNNLFINDLCILQNTYGSEFLTIPKFFFDTDILFSIDFLPIIAKNTTDIILALDGKFRKCLILDLDNTLWGGVIGDDGIENIQIGTLGAGKIYSEIQHWAKELQKRGIILAVCSKNEEKVAMEPFLKHPEMVLHLDDIAVFIANWDNKMDNIKKIQSVLNIGFDSMVFIDDNPFERNMVKQFIPEICVPELPEDPAEYMNYIRSLNLFETAVVINDDKDRTAQYKQEFNRSVSKESFKDEKQFLKSLKMESHIEGFNNYNIPRVFQLIQRSNQFNLRTIRYSEEEIKKMSISDEYICLAFTLQDVYGDYGLISIIILKKCAKHLFIDTWIMSCRVLKRNMENFVLNTIVHKGKEAGFNRIQGEYLPTTKNNLVKNHYENLGFINKMNQWHLTTNDYKEKTCFIKHLL